MDFPEIRVKLAFGLDYRRGGVSGSALSFSEFTNATIVDEAIVALQRVTRTESFFGPSMGQQASYYIGDERFCDFYVDPPSSTLPLDYVLVQFYNEQGDHLENATIYDDSVFTRLVNNAWIVRATAYFLNGDVSEVEELNNDTGRVKSPE